MNRLTFLLAAETPVEIDPRLHSDGKGWKLNQATIKDPKRPRVLLIGESILSGYMAQAFKKPYSKLRDAIGIHVARSV